MNKKYRYFFEISYSGTNFFGSQKQDSARTVFGLLEEILSKLFKLKIICIPCGRTDTGVHAYRSYCHCDFSFEFNPENVIDTINHRGLSLGLFVHRIYRSDLHALSDVIQRTYSYYFTFDSSLPHYLYHSISLIQELPLFIPTTTEMRRIFLGHRNYYSLCNYGSDVKTYLREIYNVAIIEQEYESLFGKKHDIYCINISGNGFLYKMIRHIVGLTLHSMTNFTNISRLIDYFVAYQPISYSLAPVQGLHLTEVKYNNTKVGIDNEKETN